MNISDIENPQHRNMLEHRRRQITDFNFVKIISKQHAMILKSNPRQPLRTTTHAAHGSRQCRWLSCGWHLEIQKTLRRPGVRRDHCDMELRGLMSRGQAEKAAKLRVCGRFADYWTDSRHQL